MKTQTQLADATVCRRDVHGERCELLAGHAGECWHWLRMDPRPEDGVDSDAHEEALWAANARRRADAWWELVPAMFEFASLDDVQQPPQVMARVDQWLRDLFEVKQRGQGLLALGPLGTSKSHLLVAILREVFLELPSSSVAIVSEPEMFDRLRPDGGGRVADYVEPDFLLIDDLGTAKGSEWVDDRMFLIIDGRWRERRPTLATSNLTRSALRKTLDSRVADRLLHGTPILELIGKSRRQSAA